MLHFLGDAMIYAVSDVRLEVAVLSWELNLHLLKFNEKNIRSQV